MRKPNWILAAWLLMSSAVFADTNSTRVHYNVEVMRAGPGPKDLPENVVTALTQTRDGYLWVGTLAGMARFDGVRFDKFTEANTPELKGFVASYFFEDSRNELWIGSTMAGLALAKNGSVQTVPIGKGSRESRLMAACEDTNGTVWLYTGDGQLARRRNGSKEIDVWRDVPNRFPYRAYRTVFAENSGAVWVATYAGLWPVDTATTLGSTNVPVDPVKILAAPPILDYALASRKGGYWRLAGGVIEKWAGNHRDGLTIPYPWVPGAITNQINTACEDVEGNLVVGTSGNGVWWFDAKGSVEHISDTNGLTHSAILSLCVDREGSLWVGTDGGGLDRVRRSNFDVLKGTEGKTVQSVCEAPAGDLWIGLNGGGILHWKEGTRQQFGDAPNAYVKTVFVDKEQQVWAGNLSSRQWPAGLLHYENDEFRFTGVGSPVTALFQDRKAVMWVGTDVGLWRRRNGAWENVSLTNGVAESTQAIADDAEGNLWVGTADGLKNFREGKFTQVRDPKTKTGEDVSALYEDNDGVLWIGTRGRGLERFYHDKWTHYTTGDGLISDSIGYIIEDNETNIWMGSPAGFMRISKRALNDFAASPTNAIVCRVYGEADGLPTGECTFGSQPAACRASDGRLLFPTINGLASIDPAQLKVNTNLPPVRIESVSVEGRMQMTNGIRPLVPDSIIVPPGQERLDIQFTSPALLAADRVRFKYRMEETGHETSWTEVDSGTRAAHYTKLVPGNYKFHVIACNEDGLWNENGASLTIIVEPPFWRRWPFIVIVTLCVVWIIVGTVHYFSTQRLQRQLALEKERRRIARDIHDQVGASLTQVSMLGEMVESDKESPADVEEHGRQISQTARDTAKALDEIVWAVNPSNDTLDGLITYFCKNAQEYLTVAGLRYRLDVPSQLPATPIAPEVRHNVFLAAKEAVTNIARHANATSVWIRLRLEPSQFVLEIEDNGKGMADMDPKHAATRNGLSNMRKRLEESGGSCTFSPGAEGGTLVQLTVPLGKGRV